MQEGLWLHNMYLMNTNLWTSGVATGYNESFGQNEQWKMLLYLTTCHRFWLQGRRFLNISKSFKLVGTYQSNPLNKRTKQSEKKKPPKSYLQNKSGLESPPTAPNL
jgi:hypothetical protein